jgi:hypothetical protein
MREGTGLIRQVGGIGLGWLMVGGMACGKQAVAPNEVPQPTLPVAEAPSEPAPVAPAPVVAPPVQVPSNKMIAVVAGPPGPVYELDLDRKLDGTGSVCEGQPDLALTYTWEQVAGPAARLFYKDKSIAFFTAPGVSADAMLEFKLTVGDGFGNSGSASVQVTVKDYGDPKLTIGGVDLGYGPGEAGGFVKKNDAGDIAILTKYDKIPAVNFKVEMPAKAPKVLTIKSYGFTGKGQVNITQQSLIITDLPEAVVDYLFTVTDSTGNSASRNLKICSDRH